MVRRQGWQCDERNHARGAAWQDRIYLHNQANIDELLATQKDFGRSEAPSAPAALLTFC